MDYIRWISNRLAKKGKNARLEFGKIYVFEVKKKAPPLLIVTRAFSKSIHGINLVKIPRRLRPEIVKEYERAMSETTELRRNGLLFNLERRLQAFRATKDSISRYKSSEIQSRVAEVTLDEVKDLARRAV